jgi:hypothetical protein
MNDKLTFSLHGLRPANSWCNHLQEGEIFRSKRTGFPKLLLTINGEFHAWLQENLLGMFPLCETVKSFILPTVEGINFEVLKDIQGFTIAGEWVYLRQVFVGHFEYWYAYLKPGYLVQYSMNAKGLHYNRETAIFSLLYQLFRSLPELQQKRNEIFRSKVGWNSETKEIDYNFYAKMCKIDMKKLMEFHQNQIS